MMNKRAYVKPAMEVVELEQQTCLLAGSNTGNAGMEDFTVEDEQTW